MDNKEKGRPDPVLVEIKGEMHKYRWPDTGEEFYAMVSNEPTRFPDREDVNLILVIDRQSSDYKELAVARRLFPSLQNRKVSDLIQEAKEHGVVPLGLFNCWDAPHIISDAKQRGLEVRISSD